MKWGKKRERKRKEEESFSNEKERGQKFLLIYSAMADRISGAYTISHRVFILSYVYRYESYRNRRIYRT